MLLTSTRPLGGTQDPQGAHAPWPATPRGLPRPVTCHAPWPWSLALGWLELSLTLCSLQSHTRQEACEDVPKTSSKPYYIWFCDKNRIVINGSACGLNAVPAVQRAVEESPTAGPLSGSEGARL